MKKHKNSAKMGLLQPEILNFQQSMENDKLKNNASDSGKKYALLKKRFGIRNFSILTHFFQVILVFFYVVTIKMQIPLLGNIFFSLLKMSN